MAQLFNRDWLGTNGDPWTTYGFVRVYGTGDLTYPKVQSNQGWGPDFTTEQVLRATGYPNGLPNYLTTLDMTWKNAAGSGRRGGIAVRIQSDGRMYLAEADSNLGSTRVRLRVRNGAGAFSDVVSWTAATASSATLNAGTTLQVIVTNEDADTVRIKVELDGNEEIDTTHTGSNAILLAGTAGVVIGPNCTTDDIVFDNLSVYDLETESPSAGVPGAYTTGVALVINGTYYTETEWEALGIVPIRAVQSFDVQSAGSLRDLERFDEPVLSAGDWVGIILDGTYVANGVLRQVTTNIAPGEGTQYALFSPKQLAADVIIWNPHDQSGDIAFNSDDDSSTPSTPEQQGLTVGECIAYLIDNHAEGDGKLRDVGACAPSGLPYVQADIDAMDAEIPNLKANGDVLRAVESLLSYTSRALWIDPETRVWHFIDRSASPTASIDLASDHVVGSVSVDPNKAFTAVVMRGATPEATEEILSLSGGDIEPNWDANLEDEWSSMDFDKVRDGGLVSAAGFDGTNVYMDPDITGDFSMRSHEWENVGVVTFSDGAEAGNSYAILTNSGSRFVFVAVVWQAGGPSNGDAFTVEGNQLKDVYTSFKLTDPDKGIAKDACAHFKVKQGTEEINVTGFWNQSDDDSEQTQVSLDKPAIGLINYAPQASCEQGGVDLGVGYANMPDIEVTVPTYSKAARAAAYLREPQDGWRGTAYSADPTKWDNGGDSISPGVKKELALHEPGFTDSTQEADFRKVAAEILKITGTLARTGRFAVAGLDNSWADMEWRLQVLRTGDTTGLETATDLWGMGVEYDFMQRTTTLVIGTMSSGQYDLAGLRARMNTKINRVQQVNFQKALDELYRCLAQAQQQPAPASRMDPGPICAKRIFSPGNKTPGGPGKVPPNLDLWLWIDLLIEWLWWLFDAFFEKQKGVSIGSVNDDGSVTLNVPGAAGGTVTIHPDGTATDGDGNPVDPDDIVPTDPDPTLPGAGMPGWYGQLWDAILALAANAGKTIEVVPSGTAGVPGTVGLGKPGDVVGPDGGNYQPPCSEGAPVPLDAGMVVPGTGTTQDHALKESLGLQLENLQDPGGVVWSDVNGDLFTPVPVTAGTYEDGSEWLRLDTAAGGPGTGRNNGDYDAHAAPLQPTLNTGGGTSIVTVYDSLGITNLGLAVGVQMQVAIDFTEINTDTVSFSTAGPPGTIRIEKDGTYRIDYTVTLGEQTGLGSAEALAVLQIDDPAGGGAWVNVPGSDSYVSANANEAQSARSSAVVQVSNGDLGADVQITAQATAGAGTLQAVPGGTRLEITKL